MIIHQNDDNVTLSVTQYEDMLRTIRLLKSQLKESEEKCSLMEEVNIYVPDIIFIIVI